MKKMLMLLLIFTVAVAMFANAAKKITLKDPKGDDKGPGTYTYPTDPVYAAGSFDCWNVRFRT